MHGYLSSSKQKTESKYNYLKIITWINKIQSINSCILNTVPMIICTMNASQQSIFYELNWVSSVFLLKF